MHPLDGTETWAPIPLEDYEGLYEASSLGRVRSVRQVASGKPGIMKPIIVRFYARVKLCHLPNQGLFLVHRLVALAFIGPPPDGMTEAMHLDNNPSNNTPENLKWGTHADNMAMDRGNNHAHKGSDNKNSKLSIEDVTRIIEQYRSRTGHQWGRRKLAAELGVSEHQIGNIATRKEGGWAHVQA